MPQVEKAPKELNILLEDVYNKALKEYDGDKAKASATAWKAAKEAGWKKVKGKWVKKAEHSVPVGEMVIFRAGNHETKSGRSVTYTDKDLDELVETFSKESDQQPSIIIGHSSDYSVTTAIPAFGKITGGLKRVGHDLIAFGTEFTNTLFNWVKEGFYSERSPEIAVIDGKKKLLAVSMLGAVPPAVSGMPSIMNAMENPAFAFSQKPKEVFEFAENVSDTIDMNAIDEVEIAGKESTKKDIAECLAELQVSLETMIDEEEEPERMIQEVYEHVNDLCSTLNIHNAFMERLEQLEESNEGEYSKYRGFWQEFASKYFKPLFRKEQNLDKQKEEQYQSDIAKLQKEKEDRDIKIAEFSAKEKKREEELQAAAQRAKGEKLRASVHEFCEKNSLNTNKGKELKVEENLYLAAKSKDMDEFSETVNKEAYLELSGLYLALKSSPMVDELHQFSSAMPLIDTSSPKIIIDAEKYIKEHPDEFSKLTPAQAKRKAILKMQEK